jgi:hypothetical protein
MIGRRWTFCVLIALAVPGVAQAHDSGPAIARAIVALNQGPISFDSAAPVSEQQADAVNQRLGRGSGISVAILPDDPQFSAVGAARELEFHLNRPGTIITLLGTNWARRAPTSTARDSKHSCRASRCGPRGTGRR